jgi:hypothetical protein
MFRAKIYSNIKGIQTCFPNDKGFWFNFNGRSYRKDRKAMAQVIEKGKRVKNLVESIYIEANPIPLHSNLKLEEVTQEHWDEKLAEAGNKPESDGFFSRLFGS